MEMTRIHDDDSGGTQDTLLMFGGLALVLLGAGMILTSPAVRKYMGGLDVGRLLQNAAPDFQRYLRLKNM